MITKEHAYKIREMMEKSAASLEDADALEAKELFPIYKEDIAYTTGDRIRYNDVLYKVLQDHTSRTDWMPDTASSLYAVVLIPDPEVIPVWVQPDSTNAYMKGDKVHFPTIDDPIYESLIDNNVWSPIAYPAGWQQINE